MVNTTASDAGISGMIGLFYNKTFEKRLEANLVFDKNGEQRPIPRNSGQTIIWHQLNNATVGYDLSDGDTPAASAVSARKISAVLSWKADLKSITDQVDLTAVCPVVKETVAMLGYTAALTLDVFVADKIGYGSCASTNLATFGSPSIQLPSIYSQGFPVFDGNSGIEYWPNSTTNFCTDLRNGFFSSLPIIDHVRAAVTQLKNRDVMPFDDGYFRGVIDPTVSNFLRLDADWATWMAFKYPDKMTKGELGMIEGVKFEESTKAIRVPVLASAWSATFVVSGGSLYGTLITGQGAYGVTKLSGQDIQVNLIPTTQKDKSDPLGQRALVSYKLPIAAKILNPSCGELWTYYKNNQ